MNGDPKLLSALITFAVFMMGVAWIVSDGAALRDASVLRRRPYSLARVQLWWWTTLILGSWILLYGLTKQLWPLNYTCLALLGISTVTTSAGRIIDKRDTALASDGPARHQDRDGTGGNFFSDILSDENGLSVHRFQSVAFNVLFGIGFVVETFSTVPGPRELAAGELAMGFPTFDSSTLMLLGLSSGAYITLKAIENDAPKASNQPANTNPGTA